MEPRPVRVLFLGTSGDTSDLVPVEKRATTMLGPALEARYGVPFEITLRAPWPNDRLPGVVDDWMTSLQPDIVYLGVVAWWVTFPSIPRRIQRLLGPFGKPVGDAGVRISGAPSVAYKSWFHHARSLAGKVIGGDPNFTTDEVISRVTATIDVVLSRPETTLVVKGPRNRTEDGFTKRGKREAEARRLKTLNAIGDVCRARNVIYFDAEEESYASLAAKGFSVGDRLHPNEAGHRRRFDELMEYLVAAVDRHGLTPAEPQLHEAARQ